MALSSGVVQAAAAYRDYVRAASAIPTTFPDAASIQTSLQRASAFEPNTFSRGAVAYSAVLALQDPAFVQGVRSLGADYANRQEIIRQLFADPAYAAQLPGAQSAAGLIIANLSADGRVVYQVGASIKQTAYDIQRQHWSREYVANREARLATAKSISASPMIGSSGEAATLMQTAMSGTGFTGAASVYASPPYTETVARGLAIAALAVLGAAGDANAVQIDALLAENTGPYCLRMSKLNLYQCLAVSKPHYEDVFCLGQHVLMDAGQCITKVSGTTTPLPQWQRGLVASTPAAASSAATAATTAPSSPRPPTK
jgi:hypothetical protein